MTEVEREREGEKIERIKNRKDGRERRIRKRQSNAEIEKERGRERERKSVKE